MKWQKKGALWHTRWASDAPGLGPIKSRSTQVRQAPTTVTTLASAIDYETSLDIDRAIVRVLTALRIDLL